LRPREPGHELLGRAAEHLGQSDAADARRLVVAPFEHIAKKHLRPMRAASVVIANTKPQMALRLHWPFWAP